MTYLRTQAAVGPKGIVIEVLATGGKVRSNIIYKRKGSRGDQEKSNGDKTRPDQTRPSERDQSTAEVFCTQTNQTRPRYLMWFIITKILGALQNAGHPRIPPRLAPTNRASIILIKLHHVPYACTLDHSPLQEDAGNRTNVQSTYLPISLPKRNRLTD